MSVFEISIAGHRENQIVTGHFKRNKRDTHIALDGIGMGE